MGLLGKLFGGGTELAVSLSSTNVIAGGVVAGKVTVTGGKKPLTITSVVVSVFYVSVKAGDGPLPTIDLRKLSQATVAANQPLPAGKSLSYEFSVQIPEGLDPTGSYKVIAAADIPSVKDPKAEADFKVITPGHKRGGVLGAIFGASEEEILGRYPGLLDTDESEMFSALCELRGEAYGENASKLVGIAPWLLRFAKTGPMDLRDEALETWATILNNRARPSDIAELEAFANGQLGNDLRRAVVTAATKFADEGAAPLLARFAKDPDPDVREQVARSLYLDADEGLPGRLELIVALTGDPDVSVRRAAASALSAFSDNAAAMQLAVDLAGRDPSPDVRAECLEALGLSHYHGMLDLVLSTYQAHLGSPHADVRKAIAGRVAGLPPDPRVGPMVQALLGDRAPEVRKRMAWYGVNMSDHPNLAPLFRQVAESDPDDDVRAEAVYGMRGFLSPKDAIGFARDRLAKDQTERMAWSAINVARACDEEARDSKALLTEVSRCQFADAASHAREELRS
jgi:HEAT repeat protein